MRISLIAAVAENGVIGADGAMPWHISSDLKRFKRITMGKPVVMGGKTFRAIGKPLPGRDNIVITRNPDALPQDVIAAGSLDHAFELATASAARSGAAEIMVVGGGDIYAQALPRAQRVYLTEVHTRPTGDTRFPKLDRNEWRETRRVRHEPGENDSAAHSFIQLDRR
jgi:dihydrofolate reductase